MSAPTIVRSQGIISSMPSGLRPLDISDEIRNIRPAASALLSLLMGLNKVTVDSRVFKVNEQDIDIGKVYIKAGGVDGNDLTLESASGANDATTVAKFIRAGQTLRLDHDTAALVTSVDYNTGVVTVASSAGLTAADCLLLGSAGFEELSTRPSAITRTPAQIENFAETLRDAYGQSRWTETERFYGGNRQFHNRETCLWEHKRFIDRGLFFNVKAETTGPTGQKLYKTNGLFGSINTNVHAFSANTITWDKMRANLTNDTRFCLSSSVWLLVSRKGLELIEKIIRDKTAPVTYSEASGISVGSLQMAGKRIKLIPIDHFETGSELENTMVLVDPDNVEVVTTRDQQSKTRQWMIERKFDGNDTNGTDGTIGEVITDFGLRLHNEKAHAIWYNADSAA
jgi:hypothetical protein